MALKKINLSALNKQSVQNTSEEINLNLPTKNNISVSESTSLPQTDENTLRSEETQATPMEENVPVKKMISLKGLHKPQSEIKTEEKTQEEKPEEIIQPQTQKVIPKMSLKSPISPIETSQPLEISENQNTPSSQEENTPQETKKEEVLVISDGDTNCNIIKEEKSEIFGNYQWSFTPPKKEKELEIKSEKTIQVSKKEVLPTPTENTIQEKPQKTEKYTPNLDTSKTNLERYSESEKLIKKQKQKKVIVSSIIGTLILSLSSFMYMQPWFLKSNIQEKTPTTLSQEPIQSEENHTQNTQENLYELPKIEDSHIQNNPIVKENIENRVDNMENSTKIDERLQNYLLQKYKK